MNRSSFINVENMNSFKKLLVLSMVFIGMQTFAQDFSLDLQKTCANE
jgi:hypothetical protein